MWYAYRFVDVITRHFHSCAIIFQSQNFSRLAHICLCFSLNNTSWSQLISARMVKLAAEQCTAELSFAASSPLCVIMSAATSNTASIHMFYLDNSQHPKFIMIHESLSKSTLSPQNTWQDWRSTKWQSISSGILYREPFCGQIVD